jgi:uncharacterized protein
VLAGTSLQRSGRNLVEFLGRYSGELSRLTLPAPAGTIAQEEVGNMGNPLFHWELMVSDVGRAVEFYSTVFDWEIDQNSFPGYPLIKTGDTPGGAFMAKPTSASGPALNTYFHVRDIESVLTRAVVSGGTLIAPKTAIPGIGFWAMFADPDGIPIGLIQPE